jgi:hypothetical protein
MIERATAVEIPFGWMTADEAHWDNRPERHPAMVALAFLAFTRAALADGDAALMRSANEIRGMFTALCANALCCAASNILVRTETRFTALLAEQANEVAARPDDGESPTACPTHFEVPSAKFVVEVDGSAGESPEWRGR